MAGAATAAALIAVFGAKLDTSWITPVFALVGLLPWALDAGGVRLPAPVFAAAALVPAALVVLVDRNPGGLFPVLLAIVWVTVAASSRRTICATLFAGVAITIGLAVLERTTHETGTVYFLGGLGVAVMSGAMLRRQEAMVRELQQAHAQQALHAAHAERTRIAREVHDVVAHSLTVTMLHVTGARRVLASDPARAAEALERAEVVGRESLDSIRRVVGLLREADDESDSRPLPSLGDIGALVEQYREAGLILETDLRLDGVTPEPGTALAAFRVVQEALSNVLQHSPGAAADVRAGIDESGALRIVVENATAAAGRSTGREGLGLRGMAERVRAAGGSIEVGPTGSGRWRIDAVLPLRSASVGP